MRLFGHQHAIEMWLPEGQRSTVWVKRLVEVISALNDEATRLIGKRATEAIKEETIAAKPSTPYHRPVGANEKKLPTLVNVRYLYKPGELKGRGVGKSHRPCLVFKGLQHWRIDQHSQRACSLLFTKWAQARLCASLLRITSSNSLM